MPGEPTTFRDRNGENRIHRQGLFCILLLGSNLTIGCASNRTMLPTHALKPLSFLENHMLSTPSWWEGFRRATDQEQAFQLVMLEPYQPGKIPVVLIHGLLSSPETWRDLLASCYDDETIRDNYQFWVFHYPTGITYLESAKQLRRKLLQVGLSFDRRSSDEALSNIVLVGHSMGGLVAKLEVASSEHAIWQAVAEGPFEELVCDEPTRREVRDMMFFSPVPNVTRVVYLATPHYGAEVANNPLLRLGNRFVSFSNETRLRFHALSRSNGVIFDRSFAESIPTSIDHLSPKSPVMLATARLPISGSVRQHSIIGAEGPPFGRPTGDNVVAFESARWLGAESEKFVEASHTGITKAPGAITEMQRILHLHLENLSSARYGDNSVQLKTEFTDVEAENMHEQNVEDNKYVQQY